MFRFRNWTQELNVLRGMKERVVYTQAMDLSLQETHVSLRTLPSERPSRMESGYSFNTLESCTMRENQQIHQ